MSIDIEVNEGSFKNSPQNIELTKYITLFWGYNGSGKTCISRAIKKKGEKEKEKEKETENVKVLVYNVDFVEKNFLGGKELDGIYLGAHDIKIHALKKEEGKLEKEDGSIKEALNGLKKEFLNKVWDEREKIVGAKTHVISDGRKESLAKEVEKYIPESKGENQADYVICKEKLEARIKELHPEEKELKTRKGIDSKWFKVVEGIAEDDLLQEVLVGSKDIKLSKLIEEWENSDWVRKGKEEYMDKASGKCPFCQEKLPEGFAKKISDYFDETYDDNVQKLKKIKRLYEQEKDQIISRLTYIAKENKDDKDLHSKLREIIYDAKSILEKNVNHINDKIENPSKPIELLPVYGTLKKNINSINEDVNKNNEDVKELEGKRKRLKEECLVYLAHTVYEKHEEKKGKKELEKNKEEELEFVSKQLNKIREQNDRVKRSADRINTLLKSNGFTNFKLKIEDEKYKIVRTNSEEADVYPTLSEGEKTLITFFYFITLCEGSIDEQDTKQKYDIIAIDDPVSSLSFTFVYQVVNMIQKMFFKKDKKPSTYFVLLTHNIYFLQRLKKDLLHRDGKYRYSAEMKRVTKNKHNKSEVIDMKPDEIQNEYEMLWQIVKEANDNDNAYAHPTLANAMRQILEHFFGFIKKEDHLESVKDTAFGDELGAGSHRDRIENCIDIGKTDIKKSIECFKKIFCDEGFKEHYDAMMPPPLKIR